MRVDFTIPGKPYAQDDWRPVLGYEGLYEVSSGGAVRSLDKVVVTKKGHTKRFAGRTRKSHRGTHGYPSIALSKDGALTQRTVHSIVADAFLGRRPEGMVTRHLNGVPTDCRIENLRYGTPSQNQIDRIMHGRGGRGEANPMCRLTEQAVLMARSMRANGFKHTSIAKVFGVSEGTIRDAITGRTWGHL